MKATLAVLCVILGLAAAITIEHEFLKFQKKFGKVYATNEEFQYRLDVFKANKIRAAELQAKNPRATFGVNKFMDLTPEEFATFYRMPAMNFTRDYKIDAPVKTKFEVPENLKNNKPNPTNYDWFTQGVCTPVYNQGQCGSCWAFSATETIESYYALSGGKLTGLSMEQIVDCDVNGPDQGCCYGCEGGWPYAAYDYVSKTSKGIDSYNSYPYTAENGVSGNCNFQTSNVVTSLKGYNKINGESGLYKQLSTAGPVSVCVDASSWQTYTGGVLTECTNNVDHCVQATGYAQYGSSGSYWIVRNSWGADWGESGFIWVEIGQDLCAIGDYATIVNIH
jgi:C1A family cysteine protease